MSFAALPTELQQQIIAEVLNLPPSSFSSTRATPHLCSAPDAAALASTSRSCNALVTPLLYRHVRATSPSSLRELEATLKTRPALAAHITKLHIGADNELPGKGWPITGFPARATPPVFQMGTTLKQGQRPRWCEASAKFSIKDPRLGGDVTLMERAIQAAIRDLDVDPFRREYSLLAEEKIGVRAWSARLFLLQAAVDIYLAKMKEVEDSRGCDATSGLSPEDAATRHSSEVTLHCGPFPNLKIVSNTSEPTSGFTISVEELWGHLLKPGGPADHFDHLIRLSDSTPGSLGIRLPQEHVSGGRGWSRVRDDLSGPYSVSHIYVGPHSWSGRVQRNDLGWPNYDDHWLEGSEHPRTRARSDSNPPSEALSGGKEARRALDGERVQDLIQLGQSVLALVPNVISLALTSFFHRALPSLRSPALLRSLVIGPKDRYWEEVIPEPDFMQTFKRLRRLRMVGIMNQDDAITISRDLPEDLAEVEWELPHRDVEEWEVSANVNQLHGYIYYRLPRSEMDPDEEGWLPPFSFSTRRTVALLHPEVAAKLVCRRDVYPAKRQAWREGSRLARHTHTVKVAASDAIVPAGRNGSNVDRTDVRALYAKSLRWWLEG